MADGCGGGCHRACCDASQACYLGDHASGLWSRLSYHDDPYRRAGACRVTGPSIGRGTYGGPGDSLDNPRRLGGLTTDLCGGSRGLDLAPSGHDSGAASSQNGGPLPSGGCHGGLHRLECATARDNHGHRRGDPYFVGRHPSGAVFLEMVSGCLQDEPWFFCERPSSPCTGLGARRRDLCKSYFLGVIHYQSTGDTSAAKKDAIDSNAGDRWLLAGDGGRQTM